MGMYKKTAKNLKAGKKDVRRRRRFNIIIMIT